MSFMVGPPPQPPPSMALFLCLQLKPIYILLFVPPVYPANDILF